MKTISWLTILAAAIAMTAGCLQTAPAPQPLVEAAPATLPPPLPPVPAEPAPAMPAAAAEDVAPPPAAPTATVPDVAQAPAPAAGVGTANKAVPGEPVPAKLSAPAKTASVAKPQAASAAGPKVVTYPASFGKVSFNHQQHAGSNACNSCHPTSPPAKVALDKDKAHQLCKGCHQKKGAPGACTACHKKG